MISRIVRKVLRAGSGTPARYSSTFFGALLPFGAEPWSPDTAFLIGVNLQIFSNAVARTIPERLRTSCPNRVIGPNEQFCSKTVGVDWGHKGPFTTSTGAPRRWAAVIRTTATLSVDLSAHYT